MSLIFYFLNADSGRYADALISHTVYCGQLTVPDAASVRFGLLSDI